MKIATESTDVVGKVTFSPGASSYPITLQVRIPTGQVVDGVEYNYAESQEKVCYDGDIWNVTIPMTSDQPIPKEAKAIIVVLELPDELTEGSPITGLVTLQNQGDKDDNIRLRITTEWDGMYYYETKFVPARYNFTVSILEGLLTMPNQNAVMTIEGQHMVDGVWVTDDTKTH